MPNQQKTLLGWSCTKCTYYHLAPASRCVMCSELRESKKEMHDFILGKPIPPRQEGNFVELLDDSPDPEEKKKLLVKALEKTCDVKENLKGNFLVSIFF